MAKGTYCALIANTASDTILFYSYHSEQHDVYLALLLQFLTGVYTALFVPFLVCLSQLLLFTPEYLTIR